MISVVTNIFISIKCPRYLLPVSEEVKKTLCCAFEDDDALTRFVDGTNNRLKALAARKSSPVRAKIKETDTSAVITIGSSLTLISMNLVKVRGHVHVSHDGTRLYPQEFIKEEENGVQGLA